MARRLRPRTHAFALAALLPTGACLPAAAGPLEDALARVYLESPRLAEGRAALRAADEAVPLARAGRRPSVVSRSSAGVQVQQQSGGGEALGTPLRQSLTLAQSLYSGGENKAALARAESLVRAERARLGQLEQRVLLDAVAA